MTCGAAASLRIVLGALTVPGDEYIVFTPYFPEYRVFIESAGAAMIETPADSSTFQIDFDRLSAAVTAHTKGVFVNSPNNPSGVVYTEESIQKLAAFLEAKSAEYGHPIYLIVDEPYRELVYGDVEVPYLTKYYKNTLVCYSYSKSLSLPGERIGTFSFRMRSMMQEPSTQPSAVPDAPRLRLRTKPDPTRHRQMRRTGF